MLPIVWAQLGVIAIYIVRIFKVHSAQAACDDGLEKLIDFFPRQLGQGAVNGKHGKPVDGGPGQQAIVQEVFFLGRLA